LVILCYHKANSNRANRTTYKDYCWTLVLLTEVYKVLHSEQVTLLGKNIIRTMHGPMYFTLTETLGQTSYNLPLGNRQAIEKALGLLSLVSLV
jgi:hypothetical protein